MVSPTWLAAACGAVLALGVALPAAARAAPTAWPQTLGDIAADPAVTFGVLPNGLRYAIRRNATPSGQVCIRLLIEAGSMQEAPDQHGLAHLLEHMAFHGSTHVPDGAVKMMVERLGLRYGPDANAATDPVSTIYKFDLPRNDDASVDTGLMLSREIASELTLDPKLMDAERAVVLNEAHARTGPQQDMRQALFRDWIGDHPYGRLTIGTDDDIRTVTARRMRDFYDAYYRPERAVLIVVGDVDPAALEARIKARFADWTSRGAAGGDPAPVMAAPSAPAIKIETVAGVRESSVMLFWNEPYAGPALTRADLQRRLQRRIAEWATIGRLRAENEKARAPAWMVNGPHPLDLPAVARGLNWDAGYVTDVRGAVGLLVKADRQLIRDGLTQDEVDRVVLARRPDLEAAASGADTRPSTELAGSLLDASISGEVYQSPGQRLAGFEAAVQALTLDGVNALLRQDLTATEPRLIYAGSASPDGGEAGLAAALAAARTARVAAYREPMAKAWRHTDFGPAGQVAERQTRGDLGVTFVRFANGVRLAVKPTRFARDQVLVSLRFGHGQLDLPRDRVAASDYAAQLLMAGGYRDLKPRDIAAALIGHTALRSVRQLPGAFEVSNDTPRPTRSEDLPFALQLIAATFTAPGWRADEWSRWMAAADTTDQNVEADPVQLYERDGELLLHSGDERWAPSTPGMRARWKPAEARAFLKPILERSPLEVTIVGDIAVDEAIAATAKTLGALAPRADRPEPPGLRDVRFPDPTPAPVILRHRGPPQQALVVVNWPTTDAFAEPRQTQAARVLADIMRSRLFDEIRVKRGLTYSPAAFADLSTVIPGYGLIAARATTTPADAPAVLGAIDAIADDLAAREVSADELARAAGPRIEAAKHARQDNRYWLSTLGAGQSDPRVLDLQARALSDLQSLTPADIQAAARLWLVKARSVRIEVLPILPTREVAEVPRPASAAPSSP